MRRKYTDDLGKLRERVHLLLDQAQTTGECHAMEAMLYAAMTRATRHAGRVRDVTVARAIAQLKEGKAA